MAKRPLVTVDFDDLSGGSSNSGEQVPSGYHGLLWQSGCYSYDPSQMDEPDTGFQKGVTSGPNIAFAPGPLSITRMDGRDFSLETLQITAGWYSSLRVTFDGYRDGVLVYHERHRIDDLAPRHVQLDFENVDLVVITQRKGVHDPRFDVGGKQIVLDDLVFRGIDAEAGPAVPADAFGVDRHTVTPEHVWATFADHSASLMHVALV